MNKVSEYVEDLKTEGKLEYEDYLNLRDLADNMEIELEDIKIKCPPAFIGDTVWYVDKWSKEKYQGKVSMLQGKSDGTWKMRVTYSILVNRIKNGPTQEWKHTVDLPWNNEVKDVVLFMGKNAEEKAEKKVRELREEQIKIIRGENKNE